MYQLTAPELLLIHGGGSARGHHAMRLTLMELAARGYTTTHRTGNLLRRKVFVRRTRFDEPPRPYMAEVLAAAGTGNDLPMADLFASLQVRFERSFGRLVSAGIWPELHRRGLIEERKEKVLGVIPVSRSRLTPAGQELRAALKRQVEEGSRMPKLLKLSPAEAVALAASLGPAVLLVPLMRGHFQDLAHAARIYRRDEAATDGASYWYWGSFDGSGGTGDLDVDYDSLDRSFDAFNSGSADAAGGGDGDGGGGDGGGD